MITSLRLRIRDLPLPKPKRVTSVHKEYCDHCPSHPRFPLDPESEDIAKLPDGIRQQHVFVCAWRTDKLCKGVCEQLGYVDPEDK